MKKLVSALATLPFLASVAIAGQPLSDKQLDNVVAGHDLSLVETTDVSVIVIRVNEPPVTLPGAYLNVILPLTTIQVTSAIIP
ncbi:MAG: hypothetical protein JO320_21995 [Alphaproteobacteria bacterium]|nr:hypothetical protein [Alphaproteobacteria bacterium]MBV9377684.1 hypothetical protein [Alphaproteobacteria bacterium]